MYIKYGELTIIYNPENTNIITKFINWVNSIEERPPNNAKYIFLFNDGDIYEYNDKITDYKYKFFTSINTPLPLYFEKLGKNYNCIYFLKKIITKKNNYYLDFNEIFGSYSKFNSSLIIDSDYNCIYYCYEQLLKPEIFSIIRIKSNIDMPRYQFAYDSNKFTKEEIIYLIHTIFN